MIEYETAIVWIEDVSSQPYVRELFTRVIGRSGDLGPANGNGRRLVGYAVLRNDAPAIPDILGRFMRRTFWLADGDPCPPGDAPLEAVDPQTITAGSPACQTRCCTRVPMTDQEFADNLLLTACLIPAFGDEQVRKEWREIPKDWQARVALRVTTKKTPAECRECLDFFATWSRAAQMEAFFWILGESVTVDMTLAMRQRFGAGEFQGEKL